MGQDSLSNESTDSIFDRFVGGGVLLLCSFGWSEGLGFKLTPEATKALRKLNLPGIKLNLKERCVDVNATICLHKGTNKRNNGTRRTDAGTASGSAQ